MTLVLLIVGFGFLIIGAEALVRGAVRFANQIGISPLVIGLTVVAFGTSSPELVVSILASINNNSDISLGNVIGSNIFNVLLILGASALITPLVVSRQLIKLDVPIMIGCSFAVLIIGLDGNISIIDGLLLLAGLIVYMIILIYKSKEDKKNASDEFAAEYGSASNRISILVNLKHLAFIILGLVLLVIGSRWVVNGAQLIAHYLGISDLIIGLTVVAAGTSLPEVATSVVASIRGERDIAVGNVVGSNIFNILGVLGLAAIFAPGGITVSPSILRLDLPIMIAVAGACLPIFFTGNLIARWEGALFLGYYVAYIIYLVFTATTNNYLPIYTYTMLFFVIPITSVTLAVISLRLVYSEHIRNKK
jgi:cation:H+ antiporter